MEGVAVEDVGELEREVGIPKGNGTKDVGRLALTVGVYAGLCPDRRPCLVEGSVEPEARLVLKDDDAAAGRGFFLWPAAARAAKSPGRPCPPWRVASVAAERRNPTGEAAEEHGGCGS